MGDFDHRIQEPFSVSVDAAWSACTLQNSVKDVYKNDTPFYKYIIKGASESAERCTLDVTVAGDVTVPFDPTTASGSLYEGSRMKFTIEKQN